MSGNWILWNKVIKTDPFGFTDINMNKMQFYQNAILVSNTYFLHFLYWIIFNYELFICNGIGITVFCYETWMEFISQICSYVSILLSINHGFWFVFLEKYFRNYNKLSNVGKHFFLLIQVQGQWIFNFRSTVWYHLIEQLKDRVLWDKTLFYVMHGLWFGWGTDEVMAWEPI